MIQVGENDNPLSVRVKGFVVCLLELQSRRDGAEFHQRQRTLILCPQEECVWEKLKCSCLGHPTQVITNTSWWTEKANKFESSIMNQGKNFII